MTCSDEGEVGCTERMKIPLNEEERKHPSPSVEISVHLYCSDRAAGSKDRTVSDREARSHCSTCTVLAFSHFLVFEMCLRFNI